jgi:RNA polymerase sigma-70 factor (ECF subfamily)
MDGVKAGEERGTAWRVSADPEAWVERHGDALYRYALRLVGDGHRAEDLVQETLLAGMQARARFKGAAEERTWLIAILRHKVLDEIRRRGSREKLEEDSVVTGAFTVFGKWRVAPGRWSPEMAVEKQEFWNVFGECLEGLPGLTREAFRLRVLEEVESPEVCGVMGIQPAHLWTLLHRARERLRMCLEATWYQEDR